MKQCKVCGTLVSIDSNTCPSCGNHNFFVLDVKICPLCGKVNSVMSSFCEQCGKQFVTAQGSSYIKKLPGAMPALNNAYRVDNYKRPEEANREFEIEKPVIKAAKSLNTEENAAERAYKDFIALKPEVIEKEDYSEFAYYVNGDSNKLPVVILPKFAKTSGKNIIVNIVVNNAKDKETLKEIPAEKKASDDFAELLNEAAGAGIKPHGESKPFSAPSAAPAAAKPEKETGAFKPFSAINADVNTAKTSSSEEKGDTVVKDSPKEDIPFKDYDNVPAAKENIKETRQDRKLQKKLLKELKIKQKEQDAKPESKSKVPVTLKSVLVNLLLAVMSAAALYSFTMPFYSDMKGLSAGMAWIRGVFGNGIFPLWSNSAYIAFWNANPPSGTLKNLAYLVPGIFMFAASLQAVSLLLSLIIYRRSGVMKAVFIAFNILEILSAAAIALIIIFVFNAPFISTVGIGLILLIGITIFKLFALLYAYKIKEKK